MNSATKTNNKVTHISSDDNEDAKSPEGEETKEDRATTEEGKPEQEQQQPEEQQPPPEEELPAENDHQVNICSSPLYRIISILLSLMTSLLMFLWRIFLNLYFMLIGLSNQGSTVI